ncbi:putative secreted protein (Por secretion system target) [Mangrovibacterium marinum]|uniref:Putative secreted protein (Por secretion system target) n=1 Tax=Mangrovibacterium marinum TaxID=1639118 RepID=A0A2T5BV72_9BACT|nr:T9SS type A sorting domain-containing protein [Mangrovibacterium marinum]PTN03479.1 putative secreted protein (Por secretion system target) [Mangrovibacterium marinum]
MYVNASFCSVRYISQLEEKEGFCKNNETLIHRIMENFYSNSTLTGYHRCWRYTMLLAVAMLTAMILPNTAMAQKDKETITGNILGPVPVQSPHNGTSIDGDAYAYHKDLIYKVPNLATPAEDDSLEFNFNNLGDIFYWGEVYPPDGNEVYPNDPEAGVLDVIWDGMGNGPENFDAVIHNFPDVVDDTTIVYADGIGNDDLTGFSSSTKMNDDPELEWTWGPVSSPQKDDMQNCGAIFTWGDPKIMGIDGEYGDPTELWCAFAADRKSVHGVSWISFEFLQASMEMTVTGTNSKGEEEGGFITDGPDGGRTVGDIIVFVGLFNGGDQADVKVNRWEWVESEGKFQYVEILSSLNDPVHGYPYGSILATVNTEVTPVHFPAFGQYDDFEINGEWYTLPYYEVNQWCEGAINVSALFDLDEDPCLTVSTCFISTRTSSQSTSSELKDFVAPIQLNIVADPPVAHCPDDPDLPACDLEEIETAYQAWVDGFGFEGGIEPFDESTDPESDNYDPIPELPTNLCDGVYLEYTYVVTDYCDHTDECTATFTVAAPEPLAFTCPTAPVIAECTPSSVIASTYNDWVQGIITGSATGECEVVVTVSPETYPGANLCDGETIPVTIHATSYDADGMVCDEDGCIVDFVVPATPALVYTCPDDGGVAQCMSLEEVKADFAKWIADNSIASGGCKADVEVTPKELPEYNYCEGTEVSVLFIAKSYDAEGNVCETKECPATYKVAPCPCEHIFPTQTTCCHYLTGTAYELENVCFKAENGYVGVATPGVFFYYTDFEAPSANFTISVLQTNDGVIDRLFAVHGGKDIKLFDENCNSISIEVYADGDDGENAHAVVTGATPGATYVLGVKYNTKSIQGASRSGDVSTYDFVADFGSGPIAGSWGSIDAVAGCTDNTPLPGSCTLEPISPSIMTTESSLVTSMEMLAYPNPTTQEVNFEFTADRDGEAEIELYSMQGQKVATVLKQQVVKGQLVRATHRFSSDTHAAGQYIYRATLGGESLKGIVSYTKDRR